MVNYMPFTHNVLISFGDAQVITLRPKQNGRHFADSTFELIFLHKNWDISSKISLKFSPRGLVNNMPAVIQRMASYPTGIKPFSEIDTA